MAKQNRRWYTVKQLAEYLGWKVQTVYNYCNKGIIPFRKIGNAKNSKTLFDIQEIEAWLNNLNKPEPEPKQRSTDTPKQASKPIDRIEAKLKKAIALLNEVLEERQGDKIKDSLFD